MKPRIEIISDKRLVGNRMTMSSVDNKTGELYDLILDAVPKLVADRKILKSQAEKSLTSDGKYISIADGLAKVRYDNLAFL